MLCRDVDERIESWLDGELPPEEARRLTAHLEGCAACARAAAWARTVREGLRGLPSHDAPPAVVARIKAAARHRRAGGDVLSGPWRARSRGSLAALLGMAAALAVALGVAFRLAPGALAPPVAVRAERPPG
ncbi:MAG: anti-sigma factor [Thermoanaerobaculia bacterium]